MEQESFKETFWDRPEEAQETMQSINDLDHKLGEYDELMADIEDLDALMELVAEEGEEDLLPDVEEAYGLIEKRYGSFRLTTLLSGEYDRNNAIVSINSGAGGLEAQDWAGMLLRMYRRWADSKNFKVETLDIITASEGGIKSVTLLIKGHNAYGLLKAEKGVHRLVRISPFDAAGKRHTSFASLDVYPELNLDTAVEIDEKDLKIDTYRSSGAGGQHVNVTDSAVRITHLPTGIVVQCQNERSQHSNKETAMTMLLSRLIQVKEEEQREKIEDIQGSYSQIAWGSQIRSYVFHPYSMVKDHRTNYEIGNTDKVMDGEIDEFINAYLVNKTLS